MRKPGMCLGLWCVVNLAFPIQGMGQEGNGGAFIVRGLSAYAMDNEVNPPIIVRDTVDTEGKAVVHNQYITIQFDVAASDPPRLQILFLHCDRNWLPDNSPLVQDENHNTSFSLDFRTSPGGVSCYQYRYVNRFPDEYGIVQFNYSGNWIFRIMDMDGEDVYETGRFFVVDHISPVVVAVENDFQPDKTSPQNQVNKVLVNVTLPDEVYGAYYTTVDAYQNWRFYNPYRINVNDHDPYTFVDDLNTGKRVFSCSNISPGNEYRTLDLSSATRYPNDVLVRPVGGVDQQRTLWRTGPDHNGIAVRNSFSGNNSDYLEVLFRLKLTDSEQRLALKNNRQVFLVSAHNAWSPQIGDALVYHESESAFAVQKLLRRGIYDYQYVTGQRDSVSEGLIDLDLLVTNQDWLAIEGNDWRTSTTYTAFVYYDDPRFGGFTRIVGHGVGVSTASTPETH